MIRLVIGLAIVAFVLGLIIPMAFTNLFGADTTSWDAQSVLMWAAIPAVILLVVIIALFNFALNRVNGMTLPLIVGAAFVALSQTDISAFAMTAIASAMIFALAGVALMLDKARVSRAVSR